MFSRGHQVWRQHPYLRQSENLKKMFPGLGTAFVIFGSYCFGEAFYNQMTAKKTHDTSIPHTQATPASSSPSH